MASKIQLRRGAASTWTGNNPTLAVGEIGYETDTGYFKIGDGATAWTSLAYAKIPDLVNATSSSTASTLVKRDSSGKASITAVFLGSQDASSNAATRKDYVDNQDTNTRRISRRSIDSGVTANTTLALTDEGMSVEIYGAGASPSFTLPSDTTANFPNNSWVQLVNLGATNPVTILADTGVSIRKPNGADTLQSYQVVRARKISSNLWEIDGDGTATNFATAYAIMKRDSAGSSIAYQITLNATAPTSSNHAARKDYVDTKTWDVSSFTATGTKNTTTFLRGDNTWAVPPSAANATTTATGLVQLAGDLGGTATAPTVVSGTNHTHASSQISDAASANTASKVVIRDANARAQFADPSAAQDAATKNYVDVNKVSIGGDLGGTVTAPTVTGGTHHTHTSKQITPSVASLTDAATIATDASQGNLFRVTIAASRTMGAPTNPTDGQRIMYEVTASGGAWALTMATGTGGFKFGTDFTSIPTIASGTTSYIGCMYSSRDSLWHVLAVGSGH